MLRLHAEIGSLENPFCFLNVRVRAEDLRPRVVVIRLRCRDTRYFKQELINQKSCRGFLRSGDGVLPARTRYARPVGCVTLAPPMVRSSRSVSQALQELLWLRHFYSGEHETGRSDARNHDTTSRRMNAAKQHTARLGEAARRSRISRVVRRRRRNETPTRNAIVRLVGRSASMDRGRGGPNRRTN